MAADKFGRYVWLIDLIRSHPNITFEEISEYWVNSALGDGEPLPWRTFMNHKKKIETIFDVVIECGKGYRYRIAEADQLSGDDFRTWLIGSYSVLNQVSADKKLLGRIHFDIVPSGHSHLTLLLEAMRRSRVVKMSYQSFGKSHPYQFPFEPYHLKIHNRRWYVIGRAPYYDEIRTYCLDRIKNATITDKTFTLDNDFNIDAYFAGGIGVMGENSGNMERVIIKCNSYSRDYVETLPIHPSQHEICRDEESITFELNVRTNFEFVQQLLLQADMIEVLEPQSLRDRMAQIGERIMKMHYGKLFYCD